MEKSKSSSRRPIEFHQLCAIARAVLEADPTIDSVEWKERVKSKLIRQGYDYPALPESLGNALRRVECALGKTLGPRPVRLPKTSPPRRADLSDPANVGWTEVTALLRRLSATVPRTVQGIAPPPTKTLTLSQDRMLAGFYDDLKAEGADRLVVLRTYAELAIECPAEWDVRAVRAEFEEGRWANVELKAAMCFGCRSGDRSLSWHHVIQIQHGGSNALRNLVPLCDACHRIVHPWMPQVTRSTVRGFTSLADLLAHSTSVFQRTPRKETA